MRQYNETSLTVTRQLRLLNSVSFSRAQLPHRLYFVFRSTRKPRLKIKRAPMYNGGYLPGIFSFSRRRGRPSIVNMQLIVIAACVAINVYSIITAIHGDDGVSSRFATERFLRRAFPNLPRRPWRAYHAAPLRFRIIDRAITEKRNTVLPQGPRVTVPRERRKGSAYGDV